MDLRATEIISAALAEQQQQQQQQQQQPQPPPAVGAHGTFATVDLDARTKTDSAAAGADGGADAGFDAAALSVAAPRARSRR